MKKKKRNITILTIGDWADYDSYKKLNKEKRFILKKGFDYRTVDYKSLLKGRIPGIETDKVIVFFFFPFVYWNKYIEHRNYRGIYGNRAFYSKFNSFCGKAAGIVKDYLPDKEVLFINDLLLSGLYRDKKSIARTLSKAGVSIPPLVSIRHIRDIRHLLQNGHRFFIKPRCGSMGKGITFLQLGNWQTNFGFKDNKIISRKADYGWHFRDITDNSAFLRNLLQKNILMEEAIEPLSIKDDKVDFRVYVFFNKVLYIYPRRNGIDAVTTNISQGGHGDPELLDIIPDKILSRIKRTAIKTTKALGLKFTGVDIIVDNTLKNVYAVDVNMFPGFPKRKTFNLAQDMVSELKHLNHKGVLRFAKMP